jgi:hypothetical protein
MKYDKQFWQISHKLTIFLNFTRIHTAKAYIKACQQLKNILELCSLNESGWKIFSCGHKIYFEKNAILTLVANIKGYQNPCQRNYGWRRASTIQG